VFSCFVVFVSISQVIGYSVITRLCLVGR